MRPDPTALTSRRLRPADAPAAVRLSEEAGWNQTEADWRLMTARGEATGLFDPDDQLVASALALPYDGVAWISMVLVTRAWRRKGLATRLLHTCIDSIEARGLLPVLDATPAGRAVYAPLGFTDRYALTRWEAAGPSTSPPSPSVALLPRPVTPADLPRLAAFDRDRFGADRTFVLTHLLERAPHLAGLAEDASGELLGFVLGRPGRTATQIGPLVAHDAHAARRLLEAALAAAAGPVYIDVPDRHRGFARHLAGLGFTPQRGFTRMARGEPLPGRPENVFAVAGPELG